MTADLTFHFPPELFNLLVDAIPVLNKSKKDVLIFFRGAGVADTDLSDLDARVKGDRSSIGKHEIARTVLERLNRRGEPGLRTRRDVLRRVVEFSSFDACWAEDQMKAKGLVTSIREIVNQKDAFTRMSQAHEAERQARLVGIEHERKRQRERVEKIEAAKKDFYALFVADLTPHQRGKKLETALNNLFAAYGVSVRQAFYLVGDQGDGIVEQVDGVIEFKNDLYFVEMKWYNKPIGVAEIGQHLVRLMSRAEARGIFISASDFTAPAIRQTQEMLQQKLMVLCNLQELVTLLEQQGELVDVLNAKVQAAHIHKNPYFRPLQPPGSLP